MWILWWCNKLSLRITFPPQLGLLSTRCFWQLPPHHMLWWVVVLLISVWCGFGWSSFYLTWKGRLSLAKPPYKGVYQQEMFRFCFGVFMTSRLFFWLPLLCLGHCFWAGVGVFLFRYLRFCSGQIYWVSCGWFS